MHPDVLTSQSTHSKSVFSAIGADMVDLRDCKLRVNDLRGTAESQQRRIEASVKVRHRSLAKIVRTLPYRVKRKSKATSASRRVQRHVELVSPFIWHRHSLSLYHIDLMVGVLMTHMTVTT